MFIVHYCHWMCVSPPPLPAADGTVPGGLGGAGGGEHGHPGLPPRGGESVPGAGQGGDACGLRHGRHGLAEHGGQLPNALLLLVTAASCANPSTPPPHPSPAPRFLFSATHRKEKKNPPSIHPDGRTDGRPAHGSRLCVARHLLQKHTNWAAHAQQVLDRRVEAAITPAAHVSCVCVCVCCTRSCEWCRHCVTLYP